MSRPSSTTPPIKCNFTIICLILPKRQQSKKKTSQQATSVWFNTYSSLAYSIEEKNKWQKKSCMDKDQAIDYHHTIEKGCNSKRWDNPKTYNQQKYNKANKDYNH